MRKLFSEMGPTDQNKELLNEPDEEQGAEPQTSELGDGGNEEGDTVDVFGADDDAETTGNQMSDDDGDLDSTDSLDDEGDDLDSDIGFDDEDDTDGGDMSMADPEALVSNLASALAAILKYEKSDEEMSDDEAMQEAFLAILGEDASVVRQQMKEHSSRNPIQWQPEHFRDLSEDLRAAQGDFYVPESLKENITKNYLYYTVVTESEESGVRVVEVTELVDPTKLNKATQRAKSESTMWKKRLDDVRSADTNNADYQGMKRVYGVLGAAKLQEMLNEIDGSSNNYLFVSENVSQGLGLNESTLAEDAASISKKTRKTHSIAKTNWAAMADDSIKSVLKASNLGKKAPTRRGDKGTAEKMMRVQDFLNQCSSKEVANMWKACKTMKEGYELVDHLLDLEFANEVDSIMTLDESLNESSREQITMIFENAVSSKIQDILPGILVKLEEQKAEQVKNIQESLIKQIDEYMDYSVDNFMEENEVAIETGLRAEIQESFLAGLHDLYKAHYVSLPEGKEDLVEQTRLESKQLSEDLEKAKKIGLKFKQKAVKMFRENVTYRLSNGLSGNETSRLHSLLENVDFDSEDEFIMKAQSIKEANFPRNKGIINKDIQEEISTLVEQTESITSANGTPMDAYVSTISKLNR